MILQHVLGLKKIMLVVSGNIAHKIWVGWSAINFFIKRPSGAPLHTLSKLYDVPVGFVATLTKVKSLRQACRKLAAHYLVRQRNLETVCRSVPLVAHFRRTTDCTPQRARLCART